MTRRKTGILFLLILSGAACIAAASRARMAAESRFASEVQAASKVARNMPRPDLVSEARVRPGSTFGDLLVDLGVDAGAAQTMIEAARPVFNFRRLRLGNKLVLTRTAAGEMRSVSYQIDAESDLWIKPEGGGFRAEIHEVPSTIETIGLNGELRSSLFESVLEMGESPELAVRLADIFAWDLDFYTDPRPGDTFRLVLEKKQYANSAQSAYGRILLAEYNNVGRLYQAVLFHDSAGRPAYYGAGGESLQKAFLRSPLKFAARVSSHFSHGRLHPVLQIRRPHLGTDYAAPTGTPVQTVADGRVVFAGPKGGNGNMVEIAHIRGYHSYYLHLSRILVRRGQSVRQGQTIGRVGSTGLATGPHLDFRLQRMGKFVNWEKLQLPPAQPLGKQDMPAFAAERDRWLEMLPSFEESGKALASAAAQEGTDGTAGGTP